MKLAQALRLSGNVRLAFVGAGGKTTAMFQAAKQLPAPVFITATTHLAVSQLTLASKHLIIETGLELEGYLPRHQPGIQAFTGRIEADHRVSGLSGEVLQRVYDLAELHQIPLLVEADGSRQLPIKAPAEYEPPIPPWAETVVVVAGLSGIGQLLDGEHVHRFEQFAFLSGAGLGRPVSADSLAKVLAHPQGGVKNIPLTSRRVVLLNQADTVEQQAVADWLAHRLLPIYPSVLVASLRENVVHKVHERVAGIILAAGVSKRLGRPKQVLRWRGEPFVRHVARAALSAGLSPVVVVTGAAAAEVEQALSGLPVVLVQNENWVDGQASSIRMGLQALPDETGAGVFLLSDQPQVTSDVIKALVAAHSHTLDPIVAPEIDGERANPVLFDRDTFPDLAKLEGDTGGRALFHRYRVTMIPWDDPRLLLDVDTQQDYDHLQELE